LDRDFSLTTAKEALLLDKQLKPQLLVMKVGGLQQVGNLPPRKNKKNCSSYTQEMLDRYDNGQRLKLGPTS